VVVKPAAKEEITKSGIVIPDTAKEKPQEGTVIAVGSGRLLDNGDRAVMDVREGDRILFAKYGGTEFKLDGEEYLVLKENDVLAMIGYASKELEYHGKTAYVRRGSSSFPEKRYRYFGRGRQSHAWA